MANLHKEIQYIKGVGPARAKLFKRLGIATVEDLLYFSPFRYEDRGNIKPIRDLCQSGSDAYQTVQGKVMSARVIVTPRQRMKIFEATIGDGSGQITAKWFNQVFLKDVLKKDKMVVLSGHVKINNFVYGPYMEGPEFEIIDSNEGGLIHTGRIVPIYHGTNGLSQKVIRGIMNGALDSYQLKEIIPDHLLNKYHLPGRAEAIRDIHFPPEGSDIDKLNKYDTRAHKRASFEEFLLLELGLALKKGVVTKEHGISFNVNGPVTDKLHSSLPFKLTSSQQRVIDEIREDMSRPHPMNRLLQGDVGCGKTIAALTAILIAVENGYQTALMAPTEVLAEQHYRNIRAYIDRLGITSCILTSGLRSRDREMVLQNILNGRVDIVIGTHALLEEGVVFKRLGLAVIDELPPGRIPVITEWLYGGRRKEAYFIMKDELKKGRQIYVIYPLVEESEKVDLKGATEMAERLRKAFPEYRIGLFHGRMKSEEKEEIMNSFKGNEIHVLVSTTVIEVGVDVPNATVMV